jgi:hypothetical protein
MPYATRSSSRVSRPTSRNSTFGRVSSSKKTYSKYAKAAKAKRTQVARAAVARPASKRVKSLVLSNAKAIASLKQDKYGPLQRNYAQMEMPAHVTVNYPACLHLNSLYCGQQNEPAENWIQANTQFLGLQQPVMDDYTTAGSAFTPLVQRMIDNSDPYPRPSGPEILWKSTTLKFEISGWVADTHLDIYIVQQKTAKHVPDPWRTEHNNPHADAYMPYILPQWNGIGSKPMSGNWIDRSQYKVIQHKHVYMDSVFNHPPGTVMETVAGVVASGVGATPGGDWLAGTAKLPTTQAVRNVTMRITPNMVVKQLKSAMTDENDENLAFNANTMESHTVGPWSYDNIDPKQNLWAIVTTSDPGHDQLNTHHKIMFKCHRINEWRDRRDADALVNT